MESTALALSTECPQLEGGHQENEEMEQVVAGSKPTELDGGVIQGGEGTEAGTPGLQEPEVPRGAAMVLGATGDGQGVKQELRLDLLPEEIIIHICCFLDARTVLKSMAQVCTFFHDLLTADSVWKTYFSKPWQKNYPPVPKWEGFDWKEVCLTREDSLRAWQLDKEEAPLDRVRYTKDLYAAVDVVHLMQEGRLLAAGSRDRQLTLLDLNKWDPEDADSLSNMKVFGNSTTHNGWIWSMASSNNSLASGCWDCHVRLWDVQAGMQCYADYRLNTAILDLYWESGLMVAACYVKNLCFIDPRAPGYTERCLHRSAVLCLTGDDRYIVSGSEDKTIVIFDRRRDCIAKRIQMENTYPLDMSWGNNQLWVADKHGQLHLYDTSEAGRSQFKHIQATKVSDSPHKLTGVAYSDGAVFTTSTDGHLRAYQPTLDPQLIGSVHAHSHEIAGLSYQNNVLATAGCNESIGIWCPRQTPTMA